MVTLVDNEKHDLEAEKKLARIKQNARETGEFDKLPELDNIPEIVRDVEREGRTTKTNIKIVEAPKDFKSDFGRSTRAEAFPGAPASDELEALWPGVHHELASSQKRTPSFYVTVGFMAGAFVALMFAWTYSTVAPKLAGGGPDKSNIVIAAAPDEATNGGSPELRIENNDPNASLVPISNTYEVKSGDTLVTIAMKNYKKVTPRLLDEIVKVNKLKNANVLNLGQKLQLPEYVPQSSKIAASQTATVE